MSAVLSTCLDPLEKRLFVETGVDASLVPFAGSLDLLTMKVVDINKEFDKESSRFSSMVCEINQAYMKMQLDLEKMCVFAPKSFMTEDKVQPAIQGMRSLRARLKTFVEEGKINNKAAVTHLSKVLFFTECRLQKKPYEHLVQPFLSTDVVISELEISNFSRFLNYLQHWLQFACKICEVSCALIDGFLSDPIFFQKDSLLAHREYSERLIKNFLYDLACERMRLTSLAEKGVSTQELIKIQNHGRLLYLAYFKVMRVSAAFEKLTYVRGTVYPDDTRMFFEPLRKQQFCFIMKNYKAIAKQSCDRMSAIKAIPRYQSYTLELDKCLIESLSMLVSPSKHTDLTYLHYFEKVAQDWQSSEASSIELYFEGFFFDKELNSVDMSYDFAKLAKAFNECYEQALSSLSSDEVASELKKQLEELYPFLKTLIFFHQIFKPVAQQVVQDRFELKLILDSTPLKDSLEVYHRSFISLDVPNEEGIDLSLVEEFLTAKHWEATVKAVLKKLT